MNGTEVDGSSCFKIGQNVNIQRTDGRIHSAVISGINLVNKSLTVEWFENGETKGKEIEFNIVFSLNPEIPTDNGKISSNTINSVNSKRNVNRHTVFTPNKEFKAPSLNVQKYNKTNSGSSLPMRANHKKPAQLENMEIKYAPPPPATPAAAPSGPLQPIKTVSVNTTQLPGPRAARCSNVVKEVDKIKKQREERRAWQAERKAEQQGDPGNPNYEFLSMIKDYCSQLDYKPINITDPIHSLQICVAVRKRPMNKKESMKREVDVITVPNKEHIVVHEPRTKVDLTKY